MTPLQKWVTGLAFILGGFALIATGDHLTGWLAYGVAVMANQPWPSDR